MEFKTVACCRGFNKYFNRLNKKINTFEKDIFKYVNK